MILSLDGFYLACRVYDLRGEVLTLNPYHLTECVLDCWVVALNEVAIDELYG